MHVLCLHASSWCPGLAAVCDCCTPWIFLLTFFCNIYPTKETRIQYSLQNYKQLRGRVSNNIDNPQFLLEKELSFVHLLKSLQLYEG